MDWINTELVKYDDEGSLLLNDLDKHYTVKELLKDQCWIVYNVDPDSDDVDEGPLKFAIYEHLSTSNDEVSLDVLMHGHGYTGLRECRHTYWGDNGNGYIFYPNAKAIIAVMNELSKYFDMD